MLCKFSFEKLIKCQGGIGGWCSLDSLVMDGGVQFVSISQGEQYILSQSSHYPFDCSSWSEVSLKTQ